MATGDHFVFVHGTWAHSVWRSVCWRLIPKSRRPSDVSWPALRQQLESFGGTVHKSFIWSGQNNHRARKEAGVRLRTYLKDIVAPDVHLYVLAHSHGGNVALYAIDDPELQEKVKGIVFMATPFLHFRPQRLDLVVFRALWYVFMGVVFLGALVSSILLTPNELPTILLFLSFFASAATFKLLISSYMIVGEL